MRQNSQANKPFKFYTRLHLSELTGLKAWNLAELEDLLRKVPGSVIYHHTHRFLQQHQYLSPEPPNDFAYWVSEVLGEEMLGEQLASIDTIQFSRIRGLREKIIETVHQYVESNPSARLKFADSGEEFHFMKSISFVLPTVHVANNLDEFVMVLEKIGIDSIYFHIFEARLRLQRAQNDFSHWFETSLGNKELATEISRLDPYTHTLEDLRRTMVKIIKQRNNSPHGK
jgi:hypothetical protein